MRQLLLVLRPVKVEMIWYLCHDSEAAQGGLRRWVADAAQRPTGLV